jgi:hypothetical protein
MIVVAEEPTMRVSCLASRRLLIVGEVSVVGIIPALLQHFYIDCAKIGKIPRSSPSSERSVMPLCAHANFTGTKGGPE